MSSGACEIRALEASDVEAASRIACASFEPGTERPDFADELGRSIARVLVARAEGELVGYVLGWLVADQAEVMSIAVEPRARVRGVGRALLQHFLEAVAREGARYVLLEVRASNGAAIALYDAAGFERTGVRPRYYADGEDALTYRRAL